MATPISPTPLQSDPLAFLQRYLLTTVGISGGARTPLAAGLGAFVFVQQAMTGPFGPTGQEAVRIASWSDYPGRSGTIPVLGFWVPQGSSYEIPVNPGCKSYVITGDFCGCSLLVDQVRPDTYRVYHVQGGKAVGGGAYLEREYLNGPHAHGLGLAAAMTFDDYGTASDPCACAFMAYEDGRWWIYYQSQTGVQAGFDGNDLIFPTPKTVRAVGRIPVPDLTKETPSQRDSTPDKLALGKCWGPRGGPMPPGAA